MRCAGPSRASSHNESGRWTDSVSEMFHARHLCRDHLYPRSFPFYTTVVAGKRHSLHQ